MTQDQYEYLRRMRANILSDTYNRNNLATIPVEFSPIFDKMEERANEVVGMIDFQLQLHTERLSKGTFTMKDFQDGIVCVDMRSGPSWGERVDALRRLLVLAAPDSKRGKDGPKFTFANFYFMKDGEWYGTNRESLPSVSPIDIVIEVPA